MSISGIVVKTAPEHLGRVVAALEASGLCEIRFQDPGGKIVAMLEGRGDGDDDVRKMRGIMNIPDVLCVDLAYSCREDEVGTGPVRARRGRKSVPDGPK